MPRGDNNARRKLTDEQVVQFRTRRVINGEYLTDLCKEFGITYGAGYRIARGIDRSSAGGPLQEAGTRDRARVAANDRSRYRERRGFLSLEDEETVVKMIENGARQQAVADVMFVSRSCIAHVMMRHRQNERARNA